MFEKIFILITYNQSWTLLSDIIIRHKDKEISGRSEWEGDFKNFLGIKVDIKSSLWMKMNNLSLFSPTIKDWSGLHYECYGTFRADTTKACSRQPWLAFSRLHSLWKCSKFMTRNFLWNDPGPICLVGCSV